MIEEVSRTEKFPAGFLAKIFQELVKAGLVRSNRGAGGGFTLTRRPSQITRARHLEANSRAELFSSVASWKTGLVKPHGRCALCGLFRRRRTG